jgi:hypothetical protein
VLNLDAEVLYRRGQPVSRRPTLVPVLLVLAVAACDRGPEPKTPGGPSGPTIACPATIGKIPREDCAEIAEDFGAFTVGDALKLAGSGRDAEPKIDAIKAAGALAGSIKQQRVALCEAYVKCQVPLEEHAAKDKLLAGSMQALIDLWNKRRFSRTDEVLRFREAVRVLDQRVNGASGAAAVVVPPRTLKAEEALARVEDPGVAFRVEGGAITISATAAGARVALRSRAEALPLLANHHYRVKITGSYAPTSPPLLRAGDDLLLRLRFRAVQAGDLTASLRSIEDPDASESYASWKVAAGEKGSREAKLAADEQGSGLYVGLGVRAGVIELDDVELLRGGKVIAAARAEAADEPGVKTDCAPVTAQPIAGSKSLQCKAGDGDRLMLGRPEGHLELAIVEPGGERATLRTVSLEGGRSVDATLKDDAQIVVRLVGPGSATIQKIEISELAR